MNKQMTKLAILVGAALALTCGVAQAESTYGNNLAGTAGGSAQARLNVTVTVPNLILLRVGSTSGTVDTAALTAALSSGIPGGLNTSANSQSSNWNGAEPIWSSAASSQILASAWTNSTGGGSVTSAGTGFSTIDPTAVTVASTPILNPGGQGLAHPGADVSGGGTTGFTKNSIASSNWVFSISGTGLAGAAPGSQTQVMTYTATAL